MPTTTAEHKAEWLEWLGQSHDARGDCDQCHRVGALWRLPYELDTEPDAGWLYCRECFAAAIRQS